MEENNAQKSVVFCGQLDGLGGIKELEECQIDAFWRSNKLMWVHLNSQAPQTATWLKEKSGLPSIVVETLLAEDTRPRSLLYNHGLLLISRGVNLNQGEDPEDMIVLKTWIHENNILTLRSQRSFSIHDIIDALLAGKGPCNASEFLVEALETQLLRIGKVVDSIEETIEHLDKELISFNNDIESRLKDIREKSLSLRRYLAPQKDVIVYISNLNVAWLNAYDKMRIQEMADRTAHYAEELDFVEHKAKLMQEEINAKNTRDLNSKIYILAIVTVIFLPLGLITGLLGVNLAGIPFSENPKAFGGLCLFLIGLAGTAIGILKKNKWI